MFNYNYWFGPYWSRVWIYLVMAFIAFVVVLYLWLSREERRNRS